MPITAPDRLKLEVDSPLESFLSLYLLFIVLAAVFVDFWLYLMFGRFISGAAHPLAIYAIMFAPHILLIIIVGIVRRNTDCFYLIDQKERQILYRWTILGFGATRHFLSFYKVKAVGVTGIRHRTTKNPIEKWYSYQIVLIDDEGKMIDVGKPQDNPGRLNKLSQGMAELIETDHIPADPETVLVVDPEEGIQQLPRPIEEFTGENSPGEFNRQMSNLPIIVGAFFGAMGSVIFLPLAILLMFK